MPKQKETKHAKFLRLMQNRLGRTLEEFRLIRQLSSSNYESHPEECLEVVQHLDKELHSVARAYGVPYSSTVGEKPQEVAVLSQERLAEVIDLLDNMRISQALEILHAAQEKAQEPQLVSA